MSAIAINYFLVMRTFKIYSLGNFQICTVSTIVTILYVTSPGLTYFTTGSLYLKIPSPISISPAPTTPATINMFSMDKPFCLFSTQRH